jgi:ribosomal protein S1
MPGESKYTAKRVPATVVSFTNTSTTGVALLIGESRKGVITKILPGGVKVGIGVKKTGFVSLDSICEEDGE